MDLSIIQPKGPYHFHNGHYLANNTLKSLMEILNPYYCEIQSDDPDSFDDLYYSARIFLQGSCHLFALALHEHFGYDVYEVDNFEGKLAHVFCKGQYMGREVFIDVRGITTDIDECFEEFNCFLHYDYHIIPHDISIDRQLPDSGDETGFRFAKWLVKEYEKLYSLI